MCVFSFSFFGQFPTFDILVIFWSFFYWFGFLCAQAGLFWKLQDNGVLKKL